MCTVVLRWSPGETVRILALRDELVGREFDDPAAWWPEQPSVVGGRDRTAGGSWCVTDVAGGTTAMVLNRPERRTALPGAPSRGVLPLLAVAHGQDWAEHVEGLDVMASFTLVLASQEALVAWDFDGERLSRNDFPAGTHMVTSGGNEDGKAVRHLAAFRATDSLDDWRALVEARPPADDLAALVVRHERDGAVYATVFGQLIEAAPGSVALTCSREPWRAGSWTSSRYP